MADNKLISKVTLGGVTYDLKDQNARERSVSNLKGYKCFYRYLYGTE